MSSKRLAILISGSGSNMLALIRALQAPDAPAHPALVLSNRPEAAGLAKAKALGIATAAVDHRQFKGDRAAFDAAVHDRLEAAEIDLVALAGFLRIMTGAMVRRWQGRMVNIHPSLLPAFKGLDTHARALAAGCAWHGCSVHEVTEDLDSGPILGQAAVPVQAGDTPERLAARVLEMEHLLYPETLKRFAANPEDLRQTPLALLHPDAAANATL
ncbi:MAG: phosphoribosylglycinamide formyltransferase [Pseudomonadota bacterium]